jgi:hypothetical protein
MAYVLNKTTGEVLITIQDGSGDGPDINPGLNTSDIDFFGKNFALYGQDLNQNFIRLLQNFANVSAPLNPLEGELWYDISNSQNQVLRIYTGSLWVPVTPVWVSSTAPITTQVGAQWWDSTNYQLNMYNGSGWTVVGPAYKVTDGKSGSLVEDVTDTSGFSHTVIKFYSNNNVSMIVSYDQAFTLSTASAVTGFSVISPGITLSTEASNLLYGTAVNAQQLGNIAAVNYARNDIDSTFYGNIVVGGGNLVISTNVGNGTSKFLNSVTNGNISFHANVNGTSTKLLHINGTTGEVSTAQDPGTALGVVTKQYFDTNVQSNIAPLATSANPTLTGVPLAPNVAGYTNTNQIATMHSVHSAVTYDLTQSPLLQGNIQLWANAVSNTLALNVNSLTGVVTVAADPTLTMGVATKHYVDVQVSQAIFPLAPIYSPVFTGTPTTSIPPLGDSSQRIPTTSFVQSTVNQSVNTMWMGSNKTISTSAPTNGTGNSGDFWFQI